MLLTESLPDLSRELADLLVKAHEPSLAAQINDLEIVAKCSCGDDFCASFYTAPKPVGSYGPKHRNLELEPAKGMILKTAVASQKRTCFEEFSGPMRNDSGHDVVQQRLPPVS